MDAYASALGLDDTPAPLRNNNPGALMPKGKLATFPTPQAGWDALDANLQNYGKQGVNTLAGVISKWAPPNENNTQAYIADASKWLGVDPNQPIDLADANVRRYVGTALARHENGAGAVFKGGVASSQAQNDPYADALGLTGNASPLSIPDQPAKKHLEPSSEMDTQAAMGGAILHYGSAVGSSVIGGYHGLGKLAAGGSLSDAVGAIEADQKRFTFSPDENSDSGQLVQAAASKANPMTWPTVAGAYLGGKAQDAGASPAVATAVDVGTQFLGPAAVVKGARPVLSLLKGPVKIETPPPRVEPTMTPPAVADNPSPTLSLPTQQPVGVPVTAPRMAVPTISDAANGVFAESAPDAAGGVAQLEQTHRAQVMQQIGLDRARRSAVTGDTGAASTDFQTSRLDSPSGAAMKSQLSAEKQAISNYADGITRDTGGSALNDQAAKYARGGAILTPLEGLKEWFDNQTSALYKTADERAQGVPTQLDTFRSVLGDDSLATNSDRIHLRTAISSYAKKLGIVGDDGSIFSNAQQAETMRKYLNENWSPQNSGLVGKLKEALDQDVMSAAGEDVYGQARALRAQRAQTLDNPNGIAKLLDSSGPNGINRAVAVEKVPDTVTNLPVDQLSNIVQTLKNMPPELQPMAADALAEIKAQYAHNVQEIGSKQAGQWNAKGVQRYLASNAKRMQSVFSPEEMQRFGTLNDAGNILAKDQSYPGAAVQQHNLMRAGVAQGIEKGATAVGATFGGVPGAALGNVVGGSLANKFNDAASLRATQKRMVNVSDLLKGQNQ